MAAFGVAAIIRNSFHEIKSLKAKKASLTGPESTASRTAWYPIFKGI
jgi:hypothetical protein